MTPVRTRSCNQRMIKVERFLHSVARITIESLQGRACVCVCVVHTCIPKHEARTVSIVLTISITHSMELALDRVGSLSLSLYVSVPDAHACVCVCFCWLFDAKIISFGTERIEHMCLAVSILRCPPLDSYTNHMDSPMYGGPRRHAAHTISLIKYK